MEQNNELYHHGVLGMKWGHHKSGLERVRDSNKRKASIAFSKYMLSTTRASNSRLKLINPLYYANRKLAKSRKEKYEKHRDIAKAAQLQIDLGDPIGVFMTKADKAVNKGIDWVAKNPDKAQKIITKLQEG